MTLRSALQVAETLVLKQSHHEPFDCLRDTRMAARAVTPAGILSLARFPVGRNGTP